MSGGVDSSVAAALLLEKGYDVVGASMKLPDTFGECCGVKGIEDARRVADSLGIPFYALDCKKIFQKEVIDYFCEQYRLGRTPNPCVVCNDKLKFGILAAKGRALGIDFVATGHYAGVSFDRRRNRYILRKAADKNKDQSYFLFQLSQEQLKKAVFSLADLTKSRVRSIAKKLGLKVHDKEESQEVCFIKGDYRDFLKKRKVGFSRGNIVNSGGEILGSHEGVPFYTIGQRKLLGAHGRAVYVSGINAAKNEIVIGGEKELFKRELTASDINWIDREVLSRPEKFSARIRYRHREADALVRPLEDGRVGVKFSAPQRAPSPGQAIVFYRGSRVAGGGWIDEICD